MLQAPLVIDGTTDRVGEWLLPFVTTSESTMANDRSRHPRLTVPTLVLWGARDTVTPIDQGRDIVSLIPARLGPNYRGRDTSPQSRIPRDSTLPCCSF
jgi:pimeloyl-ACP methyl ester carboxylesterase